MTILQTLSSFVTSWRWVLVAGAAGLLIGFGAGWYAGSTHEATIMAQAATDAATKARAAQAAKDAQDWQSAKADYERRLSASQASQDALKALLARKAKLVPNPARATVPAAAMKALNDPALVGETQ